MRGLRTVAISTCIGATLAIGYGVFGYLDFPSHSTPSNAATTPAAATKLPDSMVKEYDDMGVRIRAASDALDVDAMKNLGDCIEADWPDRDAAMYGRLVLTLVGELRAQHSENEALATELAHGYIHLAIDKADRMPPRLAVDLVSDTGVEFVLASKNGQAKKRTEDTLIWLKTWKRVDDAIDPHWDPIKDAPPRIDPPICSYGGGGAGSGMPPELVKDPVVRAKYIRQIAETTKKVKEWVEQTEARNLEKQFSPRAEKVLVEAYSQPSANVSELEPLLPKYIADVSTRDRMLKQVRDAHAK